MADTATVQCASGVRRRRRRHRRAEKIADVPRRARGMFVVSFVAATFFFLSLKISPPTVFQSESHGVYRAQAEIYVALISEYEGLYMPSALYCIRQNCCGLVLM